MRKTAKNMLIIAILGAITVCTGCSPVIAEPKEENHDKDVLEHSASAESPESNEHAHEENVEAVQMTAAQIEKNQIKLAEAGPGELSIPLTLPGEIKLNADRVAHVVPRIPGVAQEVYKNLGDAVKTGEVMAVLDSRELADLKAGYLAAKEREALAAAMYERESGLWTKKISAEQDYLSAKNALAEARIVSRTAEQQLHAIGFSEEYVEKLSAQTHISLTRYEILAPFDGTIIEKHITLGEALKEDATVFIVADLSSVWVDFNVYQKDLSVIQKGQEILIKDSAASDAGITAAVSYIGPVMGEETRTATARAVVENREGRWRPGQFVTGYLATEKVTVPVAIPKTALQRIQGESVVFLRTDEGFKAVPVSLGRNTQTHVEILEGLVPGQSYVAEGSFLLKATLEKSELSHGHEH
ncbi:MAG TPA: efflux RND transporter periplasmic adaptor subunit [Candidatus Hydrogenedentes bacterium]|nr:efflux RND transporter periplasmic adaptor subunit [Candidatus Hydrogenedentota bacterium]